MKYPMFLSLLFTLLLSTAARSQQPSSAYEFRVIAQPGMTIDGIRFTPDTVISSVALNDSGQVAFTAHWRAGAGNVAVFSSTRLVADAYNGIVGTEGLDLPSDGHLAINAAGQVAFEAIYSQKPDVMERWDGVFVDGQLALRRSLDAVGSPFTLTDDGQVISGPQKAGAAPAPSLSNPAQKKPGVLDRLQVKPPKLPFGIAINPKSPNGTQPRPGPEPLAPHPVLTGVASPLAGMSTNRRGQVLIPINLSTGGFMLVLGTPVSSAPHTR